MVHLTNLISAEKALAGRPEAMDINPLHAVSGHSMLPPYPAGLELAYFAMGCFWGVERLFWQQAGVYVTAVGYQGGFTPNPTYEEVCSGLTGHAESVLVVYDPQRIDYAALLKLFWEHHDPAQGMRQGGDVGTQYRSILFPVNDAQYQAAQDSLAAFQDAMFEAKDNRPITTLIEMAPRFYWAEGYHQQYLAKNPQGYCGLGGIGVCLPPSLVK